MAFNTLYYQQTDLVGLIQTSDFDLDDLTLYVKFFDLKDPDKDAIEPDSSVNLLVLNKDYENSEIVLIDSMSYSAATGITTITINAAGRDLPNFGAGAGSATGNNHYINDEVGCVWTHLPTEILNRKISGTEATGFNLLRVGDETDSDIYIYFQNADGTKPYIKYDKTNSILVYANDGVSEVAMGGAGSITAGDGLTLTASDMDIDTSDTVIFVKTSSGAGDEDKVPILDSSGELASGFIKAGNLADYIGDVTATSTEINQALDGISANVTDTNLNTLTAGSSSDADALHTHSSGTTTYTAGEALTADDFVALVPIAKQYHASATELFIDIGDSNVRRKRAIAFVPSRDVSLTTGYIRGREAAASTMTLTITIEGDNSGEPDNTPVTNGTANTIDTSTWTGTVGTRTITWGSAVSLSAGTTYWLVLAVDKTDAVNNIEIGSTALSGVLAWSDTDTYNLDTTSWTNAGSDFSFWTTTGEELGDKAVKTDAHFAMRTWRCVGVVKANAAEDAAVTVYDDKVPDLANLIPGEPYYISRTAGEITSTPPDAFDGKHVYRVGYAINSTTFKIQPGEKVFYCNNVISATTTVGLDVGFYPKAIEAWGALGNNGSTQYAHGSGMWTNTTNKYFSTDSSSNDVNAAVDCLLNLGCPLTTDEYTVTVADIDKVGCNIVFTEDAASGAGTYMYANLKIIG